MLGVIFDALSFLTFGEYDVFHQEFSIIGFFGIFMGMVMGFWFFFEIYYFRKKDRLKDFAYRLLLIGIWWWAGKFFLLIWVAKSDY